MVGLKVGQAPAHPAFFMPLVDVREDDVVAIAIMITPLCGCKIDLAVAHVR